MILFEQISEHVVGSVDISPNKAVFDIYTDNSLNVGEKIFFNHRVWVVVDSVCEQDEMDLMMGISLDTITMIPFVEDIQSQRVRILHYLQSGKSLTGLEALHLFGTMKLSTRISELIHKYGHTNIRKQMIDTSAGKRIMKYWIDGQQTEA